ncbi:flagellar motor switch protein FliN/FliY [Methylomonas methanica]|uniref:Flagellar motor switch protein FliN n=2 Tax=Methylomonas TaxID=416 RepID=A0A126T5H0_9GAMM|nr:flagellar motor switch protein FliN [Methylomonas denitrificans]OAI08835.1 flagellar motor switch protein FliN [Methylomonas methanica]TCV75675.1 flagellar motor switch protein FliN/FliY [Methylomonas methanica]
MSENDEIGDDWAAAMNEQADAEAEADWGDALKEQATAAKSAQQGFAAAEFPEFSEQKSKNNGPSSDEVKLDVILDVPVTVSLEIGRTKINIRNLLQLNQGSVVELDRFAGEPMDVLVNGTLVAHGEVVVVNDKFGIRLTDIISPSERVRKLG